MGRGSLLIDNDGSNAPMGLERTTYVPNSSGSFTLCYWARQPAASYGGGTGGQIQFSVDDGGARNYIRFGYGFGASNVLTLSIAGTANAATAVDRPGWVFYVFRLYNNGTNYDFGYMLDDGSSITWIVLGGSCTFNGKFTQISWFKTNNTYGFGGYPNYYLTGGNVPGIGSGSIARACTQCSMKVWDNLLSDTEVLAEAASKSPVRTADLNSYLSGELTTGADESGNNRHFNVLRPGQSFVYADEPSIFGKRGISTAGSFDAALLVPEPTGASSTSLLVAFLEIDSANVPTAPDASWISLGTAHSTVDNAQFAVWYKNGAAGDGRNYTFTGDGSAITVIMVSVDQVDQTAPINAISTNLNNVGQSEPWSIQANSIITTVPNCLIMWFGGVDPQDSTHLDTFTGPTGYTSMVGVTGAYQNGTRWNGIAYAETIQSNSGPTGNVTGSDTRSSGVVAGTFGVLIAVPFIPVVPVDVNPIFLGMNF